MYCYSEDERDKASTRLKTGLEITRFKGLGEISPNEFKAFVGKGIRLTPVEMDDQHQVPRILQFYMGKNTPKRREYILNHLVVEPEEAAV